MADAIPREQLPWFKPEQAAGPQAIPREQLPWFKAPAAPVATAREPYVPSAEDSPTMSTVEDTDAGRPLPAPTVVARQQASNANRTLGILREGATQGLMNAGNMGAAVMRALPQGNNTVALVEPGATEAYGATPPNIQTGIEDKLKAKGYLDNPEFATATPGERIMRKAAEGATSFPAGPVGIIAGAGAGAGEQAVEEYLTDSTPAKFAGSIVGAVTAGGLTNLARKTLGFATTASQTAQDFGREGVPLALASNATKNPLVQRATATLAGAPGSATRIKEAAEVSIDALDAAVKRMAAVSGNATHKMDSGEALQRGAQYFVQDFRGSRDMMYAELDAMIPRDTAISMQNFRAALDRLNNGMTDAPTLAAIFDGADMAAIRNALMQDARGQVNGSAGYLNYETAKTLRTRIGEIMDNNAVMGNIDEHNLRRLYGALSNDMRGPFEQLERMGHPGALAAFNEVNAFNAAGRNTIRDVVAPLTKTGVTPERAYEVAMGKVKSGPTQLRAIREAIPQESWQEFRSGVLRMMGRRGEADTTLEEFSPKRFFDTWDKMPEASRRALFDDGERSMQAYDRIARIASRMEKADRVKNQSETGSVNSFTVLTSALGGAAGQMVTGNNFAAAAGTAAGFIVGKTLAENLGARLLTNPVFAHWLASEVDRPLTSKTLASLGALVNKQPELTDAINEYMDTLKGQLDSNTLTGQTNRAYQSPPSVPRDTAAYREKQSKLTTARDSLDLKNQTLNALNPTEIPDALKVTRPKFDIKPVSQQRAEREDQTRRALGGRQ